MPESRINNCRHSPRNIRGNRCFAVSERPARMSPVDGTLISASFSLKTGPSDLITFLDPYCLSILVSVAIPKRCSSETRTFLRRPRRCDRKKRAEVPARKPRLYVVAVGIRIADAFWRGKASYGRFF